MDDESVPLGPESQPTEEAAWRKRLDASRDMMKRLQQDTARVSAAIAATELTVAGTLRRLAAIDRNRGRTAAADRREARARDAEQFAARERAVAGALAALSADGP